jgi:hypothetical protein
MNIKRKIVRTLSATFTLVILALFTSSVFAQTPVALAPSVHPQFLDSTGKPLSGGLIYTYQAGTSTRQDTYTDSTGAIINAWPIPLDATGAPSNLTTQTGIWLSNQSYKFCGYNSALVLQWCTDNVNAYQALIGVQNITLGSVTSDPSGTSGMIGYRSDIPCFRGFIVASWDCFVETALTQTLTNKTLTMPVINGASTGTGVQGTDTKLLTSSTVSGTAAPLCTDANGGATTSGCSATNFGTIVYNTASSSVSAGIASTLMTTTGGSGNKYIFSATAVLVTVGASCTGSTTVTLQVTYNDAVLGSAIAPALGGWSTDSGTLASPAVLANLGNGTAGREIHWVPVELNVQASQTVKFQTTYSLGAGCITNPVYYIQPQLTLIG